MKKLLYILLFVPFALFGQDLINIDINSNAIEYTDSSVSWCYEHFTVPSTQIDVKLELIKEIYVSYELSNTIKCGGNCGTIWLEIEIIHDDETLYLYLLDECDIEGTSGNIIFNTNFSSPDSVMPTINFITADITNNSIFVVDSIKYLPAAIFGCTDSSSYNFNPDANIDDGACDLGCMNADAINYDENATEDDEQSCIYSQDYVHGLWNEVDDGAIEFNESVESLSSLQQALDTWNTTIDLSAGWNMFGYGCPSSINVADGLSNHTESISITKDNNGNVYMPEFEFNGIGDLIPGFGYQIKVTDAIEGFSLCDWYVNDIPEDNIVSLQDSLEIINSQIGCTDSFACNFDEIYLYEDGSCEYPEQGYNCNGQILYGANMYGGIFFYLDESGERGLVAAPNDIGEFSFGCQGQLIGMTSTLIGFGQNNTENITSICIDGFTASQQALYYENEGYEDWFLPTKDELYLMYNNIGQGSNTNNIGNFDNSLYWSSSEYNEIFSWYINFTDTHIDYSSKNSEYKVRPIRAFGNWTMGCIDSLACNYNPGANMADGSCTYPELGYDCQGNVNPEIGANLYGGIVFYVDETGQHGLVAAIEDIELTYEWGCYGIELNGADGQNIGSGYQNTLDIINQVCETNDGSIHAAQATIDYDSGNYNDWYLPSKVELEEMYNTLGNGGSGLNLGGFLNSIYWSSSIVNSSYAWAVDFDNSVSSPNYKTSSHRVRPIRSF